ncbi:MAG TPA: penicillin-binding transpeptidase domain-containing protein, partial [Clostridia bacterium]|nr:penicillin-binding transpeptidase domain-containing protein [Clostridia bacterium]
SDNEADVSKPFKDAFQQKTTMPHSKRNSISLWAIASAIWLFGVVFFSLYFIGINIIAGKKLGKTAVDINNNEILDILDQCKRLSGIKCDIPVIFQRHIKTPALYGVLKPKLLIPVDLLEHLDREDLKYVILHELCHYRRKDTLTGFIMICINTLYWFNPLVWYAFTRIKEDRELLVDQMVLSFVQKHERRTYALTLVKILEISSEKYRLHNAVGIIEGRVSNMEHRIKLINMFKKKSLIIGIEIGLFIAVISVVLMIFINNSVGLPQYTGSKTVVSKVKSQTDRGVIFDRNGIALVKRISASKSLYPYKSLASHVIGYTGKDNMGLSGVEKLMDDRGMSRNNAVLTIDKYIQGIAEKSLESAMKKYRHNCGTAIVIDTSTGEILAMSSKPDFDLNSPFAKPNDINSNEWSRMTEAQKSKRIASLYQKNKAISETFIPGSSFKAVTAAMGLEKKVIKPDTLVNDSPVKIQGNMIRCWRTQKLHGKETFTNAVCNSCNPVFANITLKVGAKCFSDYLNGFGLCSVSKLGLKGEVSSVFKNKPTEYDISVASIGQGIKVTPLQLVMAYGAIANEGKLMEPHIIKEVKASGSKTVNIYEPKVIRNIISKQTSNILKGILSQCVSRGTAGNAYVKGYNIAGM